MVVVASASASGMVGPLVCQLVSNLITVNRGLFLNGKEPCHRSGG